MGKHRRGNGEPPSPFIMSDISSNESIVRHSMDESDGVKIIENSYSVWHEPSSE